MATKSPDTARSVFSGAALETLLKDDSITSQPPHDVIRSRLPFDKTDSYWWDTAGVVLSKLMLQADYPLDLHYKTLAYFYDVVLPASGPIPSKTDGQPGHRPWKNTFLVDGSAYEPSLNLRTTGTTETAIRFSIECSSALSATPADPLNQQSAHELVLRAAAADPTLDLTIYNYIVSTLFFPPPEAQKLKSAHPDCAAPQVLLAFDFNRNGAILLKCVPFLNWTSKALGISRRSLAKRVIHNIPTVGPLFSTSLSSWDKFMSDFPAALGGEPATECLSFDVVTPGPESRVKLYIRPHLTSFACARYFYTLGGMRSDAATLKGVELLRTFYQVVFDMQEGEEEKELTPCHDGHGSLLFNLAFTPGAKVPVPQFYVSVWKFLRDNESVVKRVAAFWKRIGWEGQAGRFEKDCRDTL